MNIEWSHGYNAEVAYNYGYYRESAPNWIDFALRLSGLVPSQRKQLRYLELGCGQGVNLLMHAAANPDIECTVVLKVGLRERPLPNVVVEIVRKEQNGGETVVAKAATEFDGLYSIAHIPTGTYVVRISPDQAKQIGVRLAKPYKIALTRKTGVVENFKIELVLPLP